MHSCTMYCTLIVTIKESVRSSVGIAQFKIVYRLPFYTFGICLGGIFTVIIDFDTNQTIAI